MSKILYSKFGYDLKILTKDNGIDIFSMLAPSRLDRVRGPEFYSQDRKALKGEIRLALTNKYYNPIGIFKDNKLIGISFSSVTKGENTPWLGYFFIEKKYRMSKAGVVLLNYLMNYLYDGMRIQLQVSNMKYYKKLIHLFPTIVGFHVFKNNVSDRLAKICNKGT